MATRGERLHGEGYDRGQAHGLRRIVLATTATVAAAGGTVFGVYEAINLGILGGSGSPDSPPIAGLTTDKPVETGSQLTEIPTPTKTPIPTPRRTIASEAPSIGISNSPTERATPSIAQITMAPEPTPRIPTITQPPVVSTPGPTPAPTAEPTPIRTPEPTPRRIEQGYNYEWSDTIFNLINQFRQENNLPSLNRNILLDHSAKNYTNFLFTNGLLPTASHDLDGTPQDRAGKVGYSGFWVGEILNSSDPSTANPIDLMNGWLNSPPHRNAILSFPNPDPDSRIVDIGVGCYQGYYRASNVIVCTAEFAIPNL